MSQEATVTPIAEEVPKDLQDQIGSIKALAQSYNLLRKGSFPHDYAPAVEQSLQFLQALHQAAFDAAKAHPSAALVSDLFKTEEGK